MIDFGPVEMIEQHCLWLAEIHEIKLRLTQLTHYESWFESTLGRYKAEHSVLSEGDLAAETVVRRAIYDELASIQASLTALKQFRILDFPN